MSPNSELQLLSMFESDNNWLNSHYEEMQEEHPNEYVAIFDKKIVGNNGLLQKLIEELQNKKLDLSFILIEFVPEKGLKIIL